MNPTPYGFQVRGEPLRCTVCSCFVQATHWGDHLNWHSALGDLFEDLQRRRGRSGAKRLLFDNTAPFGGDVAGTVPLERPAQPTTGLIGSDVLTVLIDDLEEE